MSTSTFGNLLLHDHAPTLTAAQAALSIVQPLGQPWPQTWVPVSVVALILCILQDRAYADETEFCEAMFRYNRLLYQQPHVKLMMHILSPSLMLMGGQRRWETFYKGGGCVLRPIQLDQQRAILVVTHPPHVMSRAYLLSMATSFRAALTGTRAKNVTCTLTDQNATQAVFAAEWG
jgi:hypothetical protein